MNDRLQCSLKVLMIMLKRLFPFYLYTVNSAHIISLGEGVQAGRILCHILTDWGHDDRV